MVDVLPCYSAEGTSSSAAALVPRENTAGKRSAARSEAKRLRPRGWLHIPFPRSHGRNSEQVYQRAGNLLEMGGSDTVVLSARSPAHCSSTTASSSSNTSSSEESRRSSEDSGALSAAVAGLDALLGRGGGGGGGGSLISQETGAAGKLHMEHSPYTYVLSLLHTHF